MPDGWVGGFFLLFIAVTTLAILVYICNLIGLAGVFALVFLMDILLFAILKDKYAYSCDISRYLHCVATLFLYLEEPIYSKHGDTYVAFYTLISLLVFKIGVFPLECVDITIFFVFLYVHHSNELFLFLCAAGDCLAVILCMQCKRKHRVWGVVVLCHIIATGPKLGLWTSGFYVLNKACLIVSLNIITATVRHIVVLANDNPPDKYENNLADLKLLTSGLQSFSICLQGVILNFVFYFLPYSLNKSQFVRLHNHLIELNSPPVLSALSKRNHYFLQDALVTYPSFPLLQLLYHSPHSQICWESGRPPLRILLRGGSRETHFMKREAHFMKMFLQLQEEKLALLWVREKEVRTGVGRVPRLLLADIFEFLRCQDILTQQKGNTA